MKASQLLQALDGVDSNWNVDPEITAISSNSRFVGAGSMFIAIRGVKVDGHKYLADVVRKGAAVLVVEEMPQGLPGLPLIIKVADTRAVLPKIAELFYGSPAQKLFCIGVTGTNGKTTTTHMIESILNHHGTPTGVIGTINHHLGTKIWETELTTPDPISFQERLSEFVELGAKAFAMEVSSIGLEQKRAGDLPFDVAVYTNLSRDHLDYHHNMETYFQAKRILFADLLSRSTKPQPLAIINADDEHGARLLAEKLTGAWSYGQGENADLRFEVVEQGFTHTRFRARTPMGEGLFTLPMPGLHNVYNAMAAIGAGLRGGATLLGAAQALGALEGVKGRLEAVPNKKGVFVFVDYAHTDGALETVLHYLGEIKSQIASRDADRAACRIITVFGCGGDRDKGKRPLMMKAAVEGSDLVVLTSDNPRTEDPQSILDDALAGLPGGRAEIGRSVFAVLDRRDGIRRAVELASPGDVILIAGKGHEDYQQIGTKKFPFSDVEVVKEVMA